MSGPRGELKPLTAVRAVAAYAVVLFHFARGHHMPLLIERLVGAGYLAVSLFFVLSGFVLTHRYLDAPLAPRRFYVQRVARLYPLYLVSLAVGFAATLPRSAAELSQPREQLRVVLQVGVLNAFSHIAMFKWNWAAWSLSVEAFFYALFPLALPRVRRTSPRVLVAVIVLAWALTFVVPSLYTAIDPDHLGHAPSPDDEVLYLWYARYFPLQRVPEFAAGCAAAALLHRVGWPSPRLARSLAWGGGATLLAIVGTAAVPYLFLHSGVLLPVFVALVVGLAALPPATSVVTSPPVLALGHASYATYILHVPLFLLMARLDPALWGSLAHLPLYLAALVPLSLAGRRFVEEPLRRRMEGGARRS